MYYIASTSGSLLYLRKCPIVADDVLTGRIVGRGRLALLPLQLAKYLGASAFFADRDMMAYVNMSRLCVNHSRSILKDSWSSFFRLTEEP